MTFSPTPATSRSWVALLAEGVGRNNDLTEIQKQQALVALLAEGVGRNCAVTGRMGTPSGRPPRGGCG